MTDWRTTLLDRIRDWPTVLAAEPYGSVVTGGVDVWSDLDVRVVARGPLDVEELLGTRLWAWQQADDGAQLRLLTDDGRFVDLAVDGATMLLPPAPADLAVRFDAALAMLRLGRGNRLIGLHLVLGTAREALVTSMRTADAATGTVHHRLPTAWDARADEVAALCAGPLGPETALAAYELAARWDGRPAEADGLRALLRRAGR